VLVAAADPGMRWSGMAVVEHREGCRPQMIGYGVSEQPLNRAIADVRVLADQQRRRTGHGATFGRFLDRYQPDVVVVESFQAFQREFADAAKKERRTVDASPSALVSGRLAGVAQGRGYEVEEVYSSALAPQIWNLVREDALRRAAMTVDPKERARLVALSQTKRPRWTKEYRIEYACSLVDGAVEVLLGTSQPKGWEHVGDAMSHALIYPRIRRRNELERPKLAPEQFAQFDLLS
jgi:hypothetical protein